MLMAAELGQIGQMHRDVESSFPPGILVPAYTYLSVTELPEYVTSEEDMKRTLIGQEHLEPGSEVFEKRLAEMRQRQSEYERYRLYPELPDWEVMAF
jgi:chlorite dismutase